MLHKVKSIYTDSRTRSNDKVVKDRKKPTTESSFKTDSDESSSSFSVQSHRIIKLQN